MTLAALGPVAIFLVIILIAIPVGLDDSTQAEAYPPGWDAPPGTPPAPSGPGAGADDPETDPGPPPA